jgi:hypothetical protein
VLSKFFREFSGLFWNLFSFSVSYFYLIEGSKIFFMNSKYFIWVVHVPIYLWKFSWNFLSIFRAFKAISRFSRIDFALKIISKKKQIPSFWIGLSPKARPYRSASARAATALKPRPGPPALSLVPPPRLCSAPPRSRAGRPAVPTELAPAATPIRRGRCLPEQAADTMSCATSRRV